MNNLGKIKDMPRVLKQECEFIRQLKEKQKELEERFQQSHKNCNALDHCSQTNKPNVSKFKSHPKRIHTLESNQYSSLDESDNELDAFLEERKAKTESIRNKLHEKLSIIDPTNLETHDDNFDAIGDGCHISPTRSIKCYSDTPSELSATIADSPRLKPCIKHRLDSKTFHEEDKNTNKPSRLSSKNSSVQSSQRSMLNGGIFERKFKSTVEKSLRVFSNIRSLIETGVTPPDGEEDVNRRTIRVREFSNRFSRNYLYPLELQIKELKEYCVKDLPNNFLNAQKLISVYQTILNALQAYQNHIHTSIGNCSSDKLKTLIGYVLDICSIHGILMEQPDENGFSDFIDTLKINAELTRQKIDEFFECTRPKSTDSILKSNETKLSLGRYSTAGNKTSTKKRKKTEMERRLAMYNVSASFRRDEPWRRTVNTLANKKFNVKSKYKTALYKHRPPLLKIDDMPLASSTFKLVPKKSSVLKNTPLITPRNEDHIVTMVQMEGNKEEPQNEQLGQENICDDKNSTMNQKEDIIIKLLQLALTSRKTSEQNNNNENLISTANEANLFDIMDKIKEECDPEVLQNIIQELNIKKVEHDQLKLNVVGEAESVEKVSPKKRKEPKITSITGDKNARLICITDENSISETNEIEENHIKDTPTEAVRATDIANNKNKLARIKISRLSKNSRPLQLLPKDYALNIIHYKLEFGKLSKNNPMYRRSSNCQPYDLMNRVSDELLNKCLLHVASEIEINDIVDKIYNSEFQL